MELGVRYRWRTPVFLIIVSGLQPTALPGGRALREEQTHQALY